MIWPSLRVWPRTLIAGTSPLLLTAVLTLQVIAAPLNPTVKAFTERTGRDHWEVLLRARAIENGCYVD